MSYALPVTIEAHEFIPRDFVGGDPALDFVNTVTGRDETPRDWVDSYGRLLDWAAHVELVPAKVLRLLARKAQNDPAAAAGALARAKDLREAMFALMAAVVSGTAPARGALALLREHWIAGTDAHELHFSGDRVSARLRSDATHLDLVASLLAHRLVERVLSLPSERLRICQGPNCSWLFIDSSKAGRRRWCDMAMCGNAAKSRRFQARARRLERRS